jgi:hypothetical protein
MVNDARLDDVERTVCGKDDYLWRGRTDGYTLFPGAWRGGGVALRLSDRQGELLRPAMQSRPQILNPGRNDLVLQAQLWRLPAPLMANEWRSVVNIGLEYE